MGFFQELKNFLTQARTNDLKTKSYKSQYKDTKVKVSFGQGNQAKIPWVAFLYEDNTVRNGIYPVFLFYREQNILILAYGVSETNKPDSSWDLDDPQTIREYFEREQDTRPDRYGNSYVYKVYDPDSLNENEVDSDLDLIIDKYKNLIDSKKSSNHSETIMFERSNFIKACENAGLFYNPNLITRFIASLLTKPFVILTGLSGSGKTKLAQAYVQWICQKESQYRIIPVGADWTNREPILGYPNALKPDEYVKPDSGVIDLILQAYNNPDLPHFLILDEMNLSHVERYFADFLSAMESNEEIPLYPEDTEVNNGVPSKLKIPDNLFVIGTVNIDETTNMFSPKVLDRANTLEFRIKKDEMSKFLENSKPLNMNSLQSQGANMAIDFMNLSREKGQFDDNDVKEILIEFFSELKKSGAEFGYRSASEILMLMNKLGKLNNNLSLNDKIDIAIMQKMLPKLHGSRRKLTPILEKLADFCVKEKELTINAIVKEDDFNYSQENILYPLSLEKIVRMYNGAIDNGFASFAEA